MFKVIKSRYLCVIVLFCCCAFCRADTIVLQNGCRITGDILVEKDALLYVDIGITVLSVPKKDILKYEYASITSPNESDANVPGAEIGASQDSAGQLYRTTNLQMSTIAECVERFAEAVVMVSSSAGTGSGFFINEDGFLITNYHVIEKETNIEVTLFQKAEGGFEKKKFKKVKIEAFNPFVDLALLKVEELSGIEVTYAYLGDISEISVGEKVFAIGNPLGLERTVTNGLISTTNRAFQGLIYLQTNADINPGNSGGPLFNLAGEVVGVTNMGYIFYGGLGFAIPVNYVKDFIENRDAFTYDKDSPNTGYKYIQPDRRKNVSVPDFIKEKTKDEKAEDS
ncbi:S1C family serine protease [Planctomycetota bacterium]